MGARSRHRLQSIATAVHARATRARAIAIDALVAILRRTAAPIVSLSALSSDPELALRTCAVGRRASASRGQVSPIQAVFGMALQGLRREVPTSCGGCGPTYVKSSPSYSTPTLYER